MFETKRPFATVLVFGRTKHVGKDAPMNDQGNCHRDRLARLFQDIPDPWVVDMLPVLIRIVAIVRRFFAAAGDSRVGVSFGMPAR